MTKRKILGLFLIVFFTNIVPALSQTIYDTVQVGKIRQVVSYNGRKGAPMILFLHGGPGSSRMKQADVFTNLLKEHFMVVQWDQRETGKTLALNKSAVPITLKLMENDTYELIKLLLKKFNHKKLYLVGESWGTVLGFSMAEKHPDLLDAYIAFSPVVDQTNSERILLDNLKLYVREKEDNQGLKELETVKIPYGDYDQMYYSRKWMLKRDGYPLADKDTTALKGYITDWSKTWMPAWNQAMRQNLFKKLPKIGCPVYFFLGEKDLQTNFGIASDYFKFVKAPKKEIFTFQNAGHSVLTEEANQVQKIIIEEILAKIDRRLVAPR